MTRTNRTRRSITGYLTLLGLLLGCAPWVVAANWQFQQIDVPFPGVFSTSAKGINDVGEIVGNYLDSGSRHGFLLDSSGFHAIDFPGAPITEPEGISDSGDIVGRYRFFSPRETHGFVLDSGGFTSIDFPGASRTDGFGISDFGEVVGSYEDLALGELNGFLLSQGTFIPIDFPDSLAAPFTVRRTEANEINNAGEIVGFYQREEDGTRHGYLLSQCVFNPVDFPGALQTTALDINDLGEVVGWYADLAGDRHGYVLSPDGVFTSFDFPGASRTQPFGINNFGEIVGSFVDATDDHGFLLQNFLPVAIDIKPGSDPNSINLGSNGNVPVAIFSTPDFDATLVDPETVTLASAPVRLKGKGTPMAAIDDVDGDGLLDLVVHVDTSSLQLSEVDTEAVLEGATFDEIFIRGLDTVRIVP